MYVGLNIQDKLAINKYNFLSVVRVVLLEGGLIRGLSYWRMVLLEGGLIKG